MSSTFQLQVGAKGTLQALKATWLKKNNDTGYHVKVSQSMLKPKSRYFSVCFSAPSSKWKQAEGCRAHIKAVGASPDEMSITSVNTVHTCVACTGRKRNYLTRDIAQVSNVLELYQPTASKSGNAAQFMTITQAATGISMKKGQACLAIREKSNDTIEAQIGQYFWLPSLFQSYVDSDPAGTYILEDIDCPWNEENRQFYRCYACLSTAKTFWTHGGIKLTICDGTHTKSSTFKHIILIAVTFDGNDQVIILSFAVVSVENADNWVWFKERLDDDFPGYNVWMSDADKGIRSNAFSLSMSQSESFTLSRCARHMAENCRENCQAGVMNEDDKNLVVLLAKARTEEEYLNRLGNIMERNSAWGHWLDERKEQFATVAFLDNGVRRFGKVTSNGVENVNGALNDIRALPIVAMIEGMLKYQRGHYFKRQNLAAEWVQQGRRLTRYAEHSDEKSGGSASKRTVEMLQSEHPTYRARVSSAIAGATFLEVAINVEDKVIMCPCRIFEEYGVPCVHAKALMLRVPGRGATVDWYDARYHVESYRKAYSGQIPAMTTAGKLQADSTFLPPEHKRPAGRPSKKRKERAHLRVTSVQRECKACGTLGHFASTCKTPSTEFRLLKHKENALKWCQQNESYSFE
jgi:hypothetical protein